MRLIHRVHGIENQVGLPVRAVLNVREMHIEGKGEEDRE